MPRTCTVCSHAEREAINAALVANEPLRTIADHWSVSKTALIRHKAEHLPAALVKAEQAREVAEAGTLLDQVRGLQVRALSLLSKAEAASDLRTALAGVRECRGNLELLARLLGEINEQATVNIAIGGEWDRIRAVVLTALEPHPAARLALVEALRNAGV
jgi:hypothetical protein